MDYPDPNPPEELTEEEKEKAYELLIEEYEYQEDVKKQVNID